MAAEVRPRFALRILLDVATYEEAVAEARAAMKETGYPVEILESHVGEPLGAYLKVGEVLWQK